MTKQAMRLWNSGAELSEFIEQFGDDKLYKQLEEKYGCSCIPVTDLYGFTPKESTNKAYRIWKGLEGPGLLLKQIIKKENDETRIRKTDL